MSISTVKIRKIMQATFSNEDPLIIKNSLEERDMFITNFQKKLVTISKKYNFTTSFSYIGYGHNEKMNKTININYDGLSTYDYIRVRFNSLNELILDYRNSVYINDSLEEMSLFFEKLEVENEKCTFEDNKKEKIKSLKAKAIEANIKKLSQEDNFEYYIQTTTLKINLHIKISSRNELIIHIPFSKFQETLQNVRNTIKTIKELDSAGVQFKIKGFTRNYWIKG